MTSIKIPGVKLDANGNIAEYDVVAQTKSVIQNIKIILESCGSSLEKIVDIQVYLTNMKQDFKKFNEVYNETFASIAATRTTIEVGAFTYPFTQPHAHFHPNTHSAARCHTFPAHRRRRQDG